jgi:hypothetical protein
MVSEEFLTGMMFAYAKMGNWVKVDDTLLKINEEVWLVTELDNIQDVEEFIYASGYDIYS